MAGSCMDQPFIEAFVPHNFLRFNAVLIGVLFEIQVMQKSDNPPELFLTNGKIFGKISHYTFNNQGMLEVKFVLVILCKQLPCLVSGYFSAHEFIPLSNR